MKKECCKFIPLAVIIMVVIAASIALKVSFLAELLEEDVYA